MQGNADDLRAIVTDPQKDYIKVTDFVGIQDVLSTVVERVCRTLTTIPSDGWPTSSIEGISTALPEQITGTVAETKAT